MLRIFIKTTDWKEVDYQDVNLALNDSMINVSNPLKMATEYSKTVSFPLTAHNREVFNHYNNLDSLVTTTMDPSKAIPARVECNGDIVFEGYFALTKVDIGNNKLEGNLYSYINVWVNKMKQLTWDDFPSLLPDDFAINKETVGYAWEFNDNRHNQTTGIETGISGTSLLSTTTANWTKHIGFVPTTNGEPAQFASDKIVGTDGTIKDIWEGFGFTGNAKTTADAILKKPSERQMMQYRSYEQKPFIFINWLCKLVEWYCNNDDTMPNMEIDSEWATYLNPNWHDLVYILPNILKEDSDAVVQSVLFNLNDISYTSETTNSMPNTTTAVEYNSGALALTAPEDTERLIIDSEGWIDGNGKQIDYILPLNITNNYKLVRNWSVYDYTEEDPWNQMWDQKLRMVGQAMCYVGLIDSNNNVIAGSEQTMANWYASNAGTITPTKVTENLSTYQRRTTYDWSLSKSVTYTWSGILTAGTKARPYIRWTFKNNQYSWTGVYDSNAVNIMFRPNGSRSYEDQQYEMMYVNDAICPAMRSFMRLGWNTQTNSTTQQHHRIKYASAARSGKHLTMKDLWYTENENSIFNVFLKYCKVMNLAFVYDNFRNVLQLMPREKWMQQGYNAGIEDWTSKVDWKKEISFKPLNWEDKFVELNYESVDVDKLKDFNDKYGYTYGTKRIETSYSFNTNTKKLVEGNDKINVSGEMSEYQYNLRQIKLITDNFGSETITEEPILPNEAYPINRKSDKDANITNCFFYYKTTPFLSSNNYGIALPVWDNKLNRLPDDTLRNYIYVTDDCQYENNNGTYCYQPIWNKTYSTDDHFYTYNGNDGRAIRWLIGYGKPTLSHYIEKGYKSASLLTQETIETRTEYCCLFSQPREDYFNPSATNRNSNDIYTTRWSNLIPEMYNEQNKLLTCKIYLTPKDYNQFKFNKFIYLKGVLYLMNKIIDYNPDSAEATKCELIQVMNPQAYITSPMVSSTSTRSGGYIRPVDPGVIEPIIRG